jgi:hypothetical protein
MVRLLTFSADGRFIFEVDDLIRLFSVEGGSPLWTQPLTRPPRSNVMVASPDRLYLVVLEDKGISLYGDPSGIPPQVPMVRVPEDCQSIQEAVDGAAPGWTVSVGEGVFRENVVLKDGMTFRGEGSALTLLDGSLGEPGTASVKGCVGGTAETVVEGFSIIHGSGSGISCEEAVMTVRNNVIRGNRMGGIRSSSCTMLISDNLIEKNTASHGAGIVLHGDEATITRNRISENLAEWSGGGLSIGSSRAVKVSGNVIERNEARNWGGGLAIERDYLHGRNMEIFNNLLVGNKADVGGAVWVFDAPDAIIEYNTIVGNRAREGGGLGCYWNDRYAEVRNSILWDNGEDLYNCTAERSVVQTAKAGDGNLRADPLFVDAANGNFCLRSESPCLGVGSASNAPALDLDGNPRPDPPGSLPDLGAYEHALDAPETLGPLLEFFGMQPGNLWEYYAEERAQSAILSTKVADVDIGSYPERAFVLDHRANGALTARTRYQVLDNELGIRKVENADGWVEYSRPLSVVRFPLKEGDRWVTRADAKTVSGLMLHAKLTAAVGKEKELVETPAGVFQAYPIRYKLVYSLRGQHKGSAWTEWWAPFLNALETRQGRFSSVLSGFAVRRGEVSAVPPIVLGVSPHEGDPHERVTVLGFNFGPGQGEGALRFGGTLADGILSWTDRSIECQVPGMEESGPVVVSAEGWNSNGDVIFHIRKPPLVLEVIPAQGARGDLLTVHGANFGDTIGRVTLGGVKARVMRGGWQYNQISFKVPSRLKPGVHDLAVASAHGTGTLARAFTVLVR